MRPLLFALLLLALLACAGCFKVYDAGISVRAKETPASWSTSDTQPELAFNVSNDHAKPIGAVRVAIHLDVLGGDSPLTDDNLSLRTTPSGVTGERGAWRIAGLQPGQVITLRPEVTGFQPGTYRLTATITPEASVSERSTEDNVAAIDFTVNAAAAVTDLNITVMAPTTMTLVGDDLEFTVPVKVFGPSGSVAHLVRIDAHTQGETQYWHTYRTLSASPAGTLHSVPFRATAPASGGANIRIEVDPTGYIPETVESDNVVIYAYSPSGTG